MKPPPFPIALALAAACAFVTSASAMKFKIPDELREEAEAAQAAEEGEVAEEEEEESGPMTFGTVQPEPTEAAGDDAGFMEFTGELAEEEDGFAEGGRVFGQVFDKESNAPLQGVAILVEDMDLATITDVEGRYVLAPLPAGSYTLSFFKSGYIEANVTEFVVAEDESKAFTFALPPRPVEMSDDVYELQDFTVTAQEADDMMALVDLKLSSVGQVDFLSAEDFAKFGGSNVADFVSRLAGVNVVEGQFAVVRGLGDRYNSTLVNSLPVPSPDPVRQGVQLDLFPTSVVESVIAEKAFVPSLPSNSSGAAFNLLTRSYPEEFTAWFEVGVSVNDNAQDSVLRNGNVEPFQGTPGGDTFDLRAALGRDDVKPKGTEFTPIEDEVGNGLFDFGGQSYKAGFGNTYETPWGGSIGFVTSLSYSSSSSTSVGTQQDRFGRNSFTSPFPTFFPSIPGSQSEGTLPGRGLIYDFTTSTVSEDSAFLAGLGVALDSEERHYLDFTYLRSRSNISDATRRDNGFLPALGPDDPDRGFGQSTFSSNTLILANEIIGRNGDDLLTQGQDILSFEQRTLEVLQFAGEHLFESFGRDFLTLSWGVSTNSASSDIGNPDEDAFVGGQTSLFYLQNASGGTLEGSIAVPAVPLPQPVADGGYLFGGDSAIVDGFTEDVIRNTARTIDDDHDAYRIDGDFDVSDQFSLQVGGYYEELERDVLQRDEILVINGANVTAGDTLGEFVENTLNSADTFDVDLDSFANVTRETSDFYFQMNASVIEDLDVILGMRRSSVKMTSAGSSVLVPGFPLTGTPGSFTEAILVGNINLTNRDLLGFGSSDPDEAIVSGEIDETFVLPALSMKYSLTDNWILRFSFGETYSLPSPRELSPVFTVDTFTGDRVVGNPTLQPSEVQNTGARLERIFEDGVTSLGISVFHKRIQDPIEQIGLNHSVTGIDVQSYINNENTAHVYGVELEGRVGLGVLKDLFGGLESLPLEYFSIGGNGALIDATVAYPEAVELSYFNANTGESVFSDGFGNTELPDDRRLFDQPEWTLNMDISFEQPEWGTSLTVAYYAQSDVLSSVGTGSSLTIDQFTSSYDQVDLTLRQIIGNRWELSFSVENLTDSERGIVYSQDLTNDELDRFTFRKGRTYSLSLKGTF